MTTHSVHGEAMLPRSAEANDAGKNRVGLTQATRLAWIGTIVLTALLVVLALTGYIEKWLWMRQLDYVSIFWTILSVQCALGVMTFVIVFAFLWVNLHEAVRGAAASTPGSGKVSARAAVDASGALEAVELFPLILKGAFALISGIVALLFATAMFSQWDSILRFWFGEPFGIRDPLYGVDVGFYVFHLPVYLMLQRGLLLLTLLALSVVLVNHVITGAGEARGLAYFGIVRPPLRHPRLGLLSRSLRTSLFNRRRRPRRRLHRGECHPLGAVGNGFRLGPRLRGQRNQRLSPEFSGRSLWRRRLCDAVGFGGIFNSRSVSDVHRAAK